MSTTPMPPNDEPPVAGQPRPHRRWLRCAAEALVVVLLLAGVRAWQHRGAASGPAPPLAGELLGGGAYALAAATGRPVLVHFWATWCVICRAEQISIDAIAREYPTITVAMQSGSAADVRHHLRKESLAFPVINDPEAAIAAQWGVRAVPATFVVDPHGQVRFLEVGSTTGLGLRWRLWWAGL